MAQKLQEFPSSTRRSKYEMNTWFNGEIWKLIQGEDFKVQIASFRGSLYNHANKNGFEIQTRVLNNDGEVAIVVQKTGEKPVEAPKAKKTSTAKTAKAAA